MTQQIPGPEWREYHEGETAERRIDALFADADTLDAEGRGYEAEALAHAAAILAEKSGLHIDPSAPAAQLVEPGARARAAGRAVPDGDGSPAGQLRLLLTLGEYGERDGHHEEAEGIRADAADLAAEMLWAADDGGYVQTREVISELHNDIARGLEEAARRHRRLGYEAEQEAEQILREEEALARDRARGKR